MLGGLGGMLCQVDHLYTHVMLIRHLGTNIRAVKASHAAIAAINTYKPKMLGPTCSKALSNQT